MTRLLLHICCGPCASATIPFWRQKGVDSVGLFFNPNIHPLLEYRRRLTGAREVAEMSRVELVTDEAYDPEAWFTSLAGEAGTRCSRCIGLRLERAAREAATLGCDAFSTSLSISPWQDHEAIREGGTEAARRHGVSFLYEDLRPRYRESRHQARELDLYRQQYCGCILSEWERYRGA